MEEKPQNDIQDQATQNALLDHLREYNLTLNSLNSPLTPQDIGNLYGVLKRNGIITEQDKYPAPKNALDVARFVKFFFLFAAVERYAGKSFQEVLQGNEHNRLALSLNRACEKLCSNCASNATRNGPHLDFSRLEGLDERYFPFFETVNLGVEGEPFFYRSEERDLGDVVQLLHRRGIQRFDLSTGGFFEENPLYARVIEKLSAIRTEGVIFRVELTYNHYVSDLEKNTRSLFYTLGQAGRICDDIGIKIVGDLRSGETEISKTEERLQTLLRNYGFVPSTTLALPFATFDGEADGQKLTIKLRKGRSFPMGRFRMMDRETKVPSQELPRLCGHLRYDDMIVNLEGDVRFCPEIFSYDKKGVTNIYEKSCDEVMGDLNIFHQNNYQWLQQRLRDIMQGRVPSCMCLRGYNGPS